MAADWRKAMVAGVSESSLDGHLPSGKRVVTIKCRTCKKNVGYVTHEPEGFQLSAWGPTNSSLPRSTGAPLYTLVMGDVPADAIVFHCFRHGAVTLAAGELSLAVTAYEQTGKRRTRLA